MSCLLLVFRFWVGGLYCNCSHRPWQHRPCRRVLPDAGYMMSPPNIALLVNAGDIGYCAKTSAQRLLKINELGVCDG